MQEKRKLKRRHLMYYLRVFEKNTDTLLGYLVDITPEGIMIMSESPVEKGMVFHLRMQLDTELTDKKYLDFDARSLWCRNDLNPDFYDAGFELVNVSYKDFRSIEEIIEKLGFRD